MGKKILKTSLFTLLALVLITIIGFSLACLISPGKLSDFTKQLGIDYFSTELAVYQYKRSSDINDLGIVVERAVDSSSHDHVKTYSEELMKNQRYGEFVAFKNKQFDKENTSNIDFYYDNFIEGNYIYSCYKVDGQSTSLFMKATSFVEKTPNEYLLANPVSMYVLAAIADSEKEQISMVTAYLSSKYSALVALGNSEYNSDIKRICYDNYTMYKSIADLVNMRKWQNLFENIE